MGFSLVTCNQGHMEQLMKIQEKIKLFSSLKKKAVTQHCSDVAGISTRVRQETEVCEGIQCVKEFNLLKCYLYISNGKATAKQKQSSK